MSLALEIVGASKAFDGRPALKQASFSCGWGEVHALLGENGAGKSTLMNVACGLYAPDEGSIAVDGQPAAITAPADAAKLGIGMVHQHYKLVKRFTIAENIVLACRDALGMRRPRDAAEAVAAKAAEVGFDIDPGAVVGNLSIAEQQRVEILKVLLLGARILILDEPTSVLTDQESVAALTFMRRLAEDGHAVVLITHKLREVIGYSSRVTVMRGGETVLAGAETAGLDAATLARTMVGEEGEEQARRDRPLGDVRLQVEDLTARRAGGIGVDGIGFAVRSGEIYGIAGVGGNGQQELADALTGLRAPTQGRIAIDGTDLAGKAVPAFRRRGMRAIPADRFRNGLLAELAVYENFGVTGVPAGDYGSPALVRRGAMKAAAARAIDAHTIHGAAPGTAARLLSGGNAQKLLLARELKGEASVLVAHSPTRGLDVSACRTVHDLLQGAADAGTACVLISEDLEEVLALSTTIAVISRGRLVGEFAAGEVSRAEIGRLMLGHA
ncbi:MAG: ATP-binding cassette domain-containing protein [Rhodospirillales bacterium]|nr:ATP-binding cassette domain-containing protein [Rhodospirillales bacterium]